MPGRAQRRPVPRSQAAISPCATPPLLRTVSSQWNRRQARRWEIHEMEMRDGVMKMRRLEHGLALPSARGRGAWSWQLPRDVDRAACALRGEVGKAVKVTLVFEHARRMDVSFDIRSMGASAPEGDDHAEHRYWQPPSRRRLSLGMGLGGGARAAGDLQQPGEAKDRRRHRGLSAGLLCGGLQHGLAMRSLPAGSRRVPLDCSRLRTAAIDLPRSSMTLARGLACRCNCAGGGGNSIGV